MLIIVGILLDKFGIRFSTITSAIAMVVGALIKYYAFVGDFAPDATILGLDSRVFFAAFGFALFGVGIEYAGITATKAISAGEAVKYDYSTTWLIFIGLTLLGVVFAFLLKAEDKKKGYGLELPNMG